MAGHWRKRLRRTVIEFAAREHHNRESIARRAGISPETLSRVLSGRHAAPSFETIVRITRATHESIAYIAGERGIALQDEATLLQYLRGLIQHLQTIIEQLERHLDNATAKE